MPPNVSSKTEFVWQSHCAIQGEVVHKIYTLCNTALPIAPKHSQEIFLLVSRLQLIRSPERDLNGVALDPFTSDKKQTKSEMKGLILIILIKYIIFQR